MIQRLTLLTAAVLLGAGLALAQDPSTAIVATPISDAMVVRGDDGLDHVEYDLLVTSVFDGPVTVSSVEIAGPDGTALGTIEGDTLADAMQTLLSQQPAAEIPPSGSVAIEIDLALDPASPPPARLTHRIAYAVPEGDHAAPLLRGRVVTGEVAVSPAQAVTILSPLAGPNWVGLNACCAPNAHRSLRVGSNARIAKPEQFAVDWVRVEDGRVFDGDGSANEQYPYFGAEVRSAAAGEVVDLRDGAPEIAPGQRADLQGPDDYGGNYLLIRIAPEVYAFYAHLQPGSLKVGIGDAVTAGQPLALLGNSGNTTAPHLHFGLLDRPDFILGSALPFAIENFEVTGTVTGADETGLTIEPQSRRVDLGYPLVGSVATFP